MVDFERKVVTVVKLYTFSTIWLQKLDYCLTPIYISLSIILKMFSLDCYKQRDNN